MKRVVTVLAASLLLGCLPSCKSAPKTSVPTDPETSVESLEVEPMFPASRRPATTAGAEARVVGTVVIVVNEEIVTKEEILNELADDFAKVDADRSYSEAGRETRKAELIRDELRFSAERLLALQEARRRLTQEELDRIDHDVDYYVKSLIRTVGSAAQLERELAREGATIESRRTREREQRMLAQLWRDEISQHTFVRPAEMRGYYDTHKADFHCVRAVRIRQIFLPFAAYSGKAQARQKGIDLLERLQKGGDFAHLAREYSQGPHAADGGLWEDFIEAGSGEVRPEVEQVAFRLRVKRTSQLIESEIGYHIIKVEDVRPARQIPFAEVQEEISDILQKEKHEARKREFIEKLWKDSYVQVRWQ